MRAAAAKESNVDGQPDRRAPLAMDAATFRELGHASSISSPGCIEAVPRGR